MELVDLGGIEYGAEVRHILEADQFSPEVMNHIFDNAQDCKRSVLNKTPLEPQINTIDPIISFFEEPSTRTRFSFEMAASRLGFSVVGTEAGKVFSSRLKGESIRDTALNLRGYHPSAIIARTSSAGDAQSMADVLNVPLVNAGDGSGEHPTQAMLDAYTVNERFNGLSGLNLVLGGDLKHGRTVRSLVRIMKQYPNNEFLFVSPKGLRMNDDIKDELVKENVPWEETEDVAEAMDWGDVVYWTRLQVERIIDPVERRDVLKSQRAFQIVPEHMKLLRQDAVLMHPLPKVEPGFIDSDGQELIAEIDPEVDEDPRAIYFDQSENGLYVRMALIKWALDPVYGPRGTYPPIQ